MAFVKKDWQYNDIITEGELNRIEQGIVEANQKADQNASALASHLNDNVTAHGLGNRPLASTASVTYYVDAVNGNDNNDGLSASTAFKTWDKVLSKIPRFIKHEITVRIIGNLPELLVIDNTVVGYNGSLIIRGDTDNPSNHIVSGVKVISSKNISIQYIQSSGQINIDNSFFTLSNCYPRASGTLGVSVNFSIVRIGPCNFGTGVVQDCIMAYNASQIHSYNNTGQGTRYGLVSSEGSTIGKNGTQPTGAMANEWVFGGGVIR